MIRSLIVAVALFAAFFLVSALGAPGRSAARPELRPAVVHPSPARPGVIPNALPVRLTGSQLATAARRCAAWAAKAGFPNTSLAHGRLTTAVAVALAETGCDSAACFNNSTRRACTQPTTQPTSQPSTQPSTQPTSQAGTRAGRQHGRDSVFRGAWQVGGQGRTGVSDTCAYQGRCNGRAAYRVVAGYGTDLRPWTAYLTGHYQRYLAAAARAVSILRQGALPSAVTGLCAEYVTDQPGAWAWLGRCGRGSANGQWTLSGQQLRTSSGLCLTASTASTGGTAGSGGTGGAAGSGGTASTDRTGSTGGTTRTATTASTARPGPVTVARCTGSSFQDWQPGAAFALTNAGARLCLTAVGSPAPPGTTLTVQRCAGRRGQRWFRP